MLKRKPSEFVQMDSKGAMEALNEWLGSNAKALTQELNRPATVSEIEKTEESIGVKFPKSVREAYLIHNGENDSSDGIFGCWRWLSLEEVKLWHNELKGIEDEYKNGDFKPNIIPLLLSGGGDIYYVESVAGPEQESEFIEWWHEQPTRDVKFNSFATFLSDFVWQLKLGKYAYNPSILNALIDKSDLSPQEIELNFSNLGVWRKLYLTLFWVFSVVVSGYIFIGCITERNDLNSSHLFYPFLLMGFTVWNHLAIVKRKLTQLKVLAFLHVLMFNIVSAFITFMILGASENEVRGKNA